MADIPIFDFGGAQKSKLVVLQNNSWAYFNIQGKLIRNHISADEVQKEYGYRLKWGKPSNEDDDYDMKQASKKE